jgi:MFS family permease
VNTARNRGISAQPMFRRLLVGTSLSRFGDSALYLSLSIWTKDLTGSNAAAGAIFLAQGLPSFAAPWTGYWIDRVHRKSLLIGVNAVSAVAVLSLLFVRSSSQIWLIYAFSAFYGATATINGPAMSGLVKDMLPDSQLPSANAAFATLGQGLRIASPLVGAALYTQFGGGSLAIFDAATFAVSVAVLASLRITESVIPPAEQVPLRQRLLAGAEYVRATPILRQMVTASIMTMLVLGFYESLTFAVIAALGKSPSFFGILMSVQGCGSILGGFIAGRLVRRAGVPRTLGIALLLWAVASLIYTLPVVAIACVALFIFGIAVPVNSVATGVATQRFAPPRMQGRVGSAFTMVTNLAQTLSIAIGAALVGSVNYRILLAVVVVVAAAAAVPVLVRPAQEPAITSSAETEDGQLRKKEECRVPGKSVLGCSTRPGRTARRSAPIRRSANWPRAAGSVRNWPAHSSTPA